MVPGDLPTAPAFLLLIRPEVQGHMMQGPGADSTWVSYLWPQPQDAPQRAGTPPPEAEPLTWVLLPPSYPSCPVPGQCPPEIHLLNSWVHAEEVSQEEGAPGRQSHLAQPEKERGKT